MEVKIFKEFVGVFGMTIFWFKEEDEDEDEDERCSYDLWIYSILLKKYFIK